MTLVVKSIFFLLIIFFNTSLHAQLNNPFDVKLTSVQIGEKTLPPSGWDAIKFQADKILKISFITEGRPSEQIYYRIYLDGDILETRYLKSEYSFKGFKTGLHIIRIIPVTQSGEVGKPLVTSLNAVEKIEEIEKQKEFSLNDLLFSPLAVYVLAGIIVLQFIFITVFLKRKSGNKIQESLMDQSLQELSELKHSYKRIIDELKNQNEENEHLRKKIKELEQNINMLESSNLHLLKQKEKLAESKRKLEILHKQKEELFTMAIHDIKNPASAIQNYIQLLNSYELNASEQQEIMASIVTSSENIIKLSHNMCDIIAKSMPEPKKQLMNASLMSIVDNVCNQNSSYAKTKKVKLLNKSSRDLPELSIDPEKIEEALDNLVNNAIKYAHPNTIVEVHSSVKQTDDKKVVVVEVKDNGVGLSEEDQKKCFQKGVKLTPTPTGLEQSSGLGLWIVKRIIDDHDGKVWVESKLNAGSTFGFELPVNSK